MSCCLAGHRVKNDPMPFEPSSEVKFEIGHVLFIDIVGYSKLLINQQSEQLETLRKIVRATEQFQIAEREGKLLRLPTGDGGALVFRNSVEAPVLCATEISKALKSHPELRVRMGIHSGPVNEITDLNEQANIAGAGINIAQRVMDCGDAGHILLSRHVAEDLENYARWHPYLHTLGDCEVKHGQRISLVNFFTAEIGNPNPPKKCLAAQEKESAAASSIFRSPPALITIATLLVILFAVGVFFFSRGKLLQSWRTGVPPAGNRSVAVLPFENTTNDPNAEYLAEGISEALINSLTELQQLRVIARTTAFHYKGKEINPKQVGRELNVGAVLMGRVRQIQDALSIQVDLVDAGTGAQLWGAAFDRKISDVVAVKQAIAREVTEKLKLRLSGEEERRLIKRDTTNADAYQFYLRGRYLWNKRTPEAIKQASEQFQRAIDADPNFALGYSGLADTYLLLEQYAGMPWIEVMPKARAAAERALKIDDSLAEAHASSALVYQFNWQWAEAEKEFRRAISLNPNYPTAHHWYALFLNVRYRFDDALGEIDRAQELDPLSPIISANVAITLLAKNDVTGAIEQCQRIIAFAPNHPAGYDWLGLAYYKQGRISEAIPLREKVVEMVQRASTQLGVLGHLYAIAGRQTEARGILKDLENKCARREAVGQSLALIHDGLGERDQAFAWLEKDFEQHSAELQYITIRPQFEQLRRDPRGVDLLRRMGLNP